MKTVNHSTASGLLSTSVASFNVKILQDELIESSPHSHDYFKIIWITSGSGIHSIGMDQYPINCNQVFCIKPGQLHQFWPDAGIVGFSFLFTESFINTTELEFGIHNQSHFFHLFSKLNGSVVSAEMADDLNEIAYKIKREMDLFRNETLKRYLKILFIHLGHHLQNSLQTVVQTRNDEMVQQFIRLVDRYFKEKKMVADYAGDLCVTPNYLNEVIKKCTGHSAGYHIRQRIIVEAKRLALLSCRSMKEIAYELGFLDTAHFSKFFKMVTGNNFSQFKKEMLTLSEAV